MTLVHEHVINDVRRALEAGLRKRLPKKGKKLIAILLRNWGKVAHALDVALLNHRYKQLTFVVRWPSTRYEALFIVFRKDRIHKEWVFRKAFLKKRGGWTYKWEIIVNGEDDLLFIRNVKEVSTVEEEIPA